jgi:hypothetical protein
MARNPRRIATLNKPWNIAQPTSVFQGVTYIAAEWIN